MASEIGIAYTLTTPGGTISFNAGTTDDFRVENIEGLDGAPIRTSEYNRPQTDGGFLGDFFLGPRHTTWDGTVIVRSSTTNVGIRTQRNAMLANLQTALNSILRANGTMTWTPTGGSLKTLIVRNDIPLNVTGSEGMLKKFLFGLLSADPTIV